MQTTHQALIIAALTLSSGANAISLEPAQGLNVNQPYYAPETFVQQRSLPVVDIRGLDSKSYVTVFEKQIGDEVRRGIKEAEYVYKLAGIDVVEFEKDSMKVLENSRKLNPEYFEVVEALAEVGGISVERMFTLSQLDAALASAAQSSLSGCTTISFAGTGVVGQVNDTPSLSGGNYWVLQADDYVQVMASGFYGSGQTLGKDIGVVINFQGTDSKGVGLQSNSAIELGALQNYLARHAKSVEEAEKILEKHRTVVASHFNFADTNGDTIGIEMLEGDNYVIKRPAGIGHANHSERPGVMQSFAESVGLGEKSRKRTIATAYTEWRAEFAQQFIDNSPEGNVDAAKYVLNTKPIAQHAAYGSDFISTLTAVMDTKEGCLEVAPGVGEWNDFQKVCLEK
ncbi:C45 family autoproteolytic acyltransferase/hydrolase [Vibrio mediterranei]|uniref:C45 family autoproteolytic acyltransferase/hydolase n=1 Tax=Vibrio mediterranei TaxID=689 RepID=UPI001EFD864D|nr:C45 family peptidase [Vibrio mediterranei]MCG9657803.1 C45 family autoproteolytic acyltransferase/hydrolase [Vibrio mediterranei]MCG9662773.1 C45 family autoproteolytic acyltransferase/hydrolase [Vibrio mediterranei]